MGTVCYMDKTEAFLNVFVYFPLCVFLAGWIVVSLYRICRNKE